MKQNMSKRLLLALALLILSALCLPALADHHHHTTYSRAVLLPVVEPDAKPEEGDLTITYNANGGKGSITDDGKYAPGAKIEIKSGSALTPPSPEKEGAAEKAFAGWSLDKLALKPDPEYAPGRTVKLEKSLTLYAVWVQSGKQRTASIIYHYNTHGDKKYTQEYLDGEKVTLLSLGGCGWSEPKDETFLGWSADEYAVKAEFKPGQKVYVSGEKNHLFAVWQEDGAHISVNKYITNKKWDKGGNLYHFKAGDKVRFHIVVSNTGNVTIPKIIVYEALKGAKIKSGSGYHVDGDGDAIIKNLAPQESVVVRASYTVKSSDQTKKKVINTAYAYYGKGEESDSARIPVKKRSSSSSSTTTVVPTPQPITTLTVYADRTLRTALNGIAYDYQLANSQVRINLIYDDSELLDTRIQNGTYGDIIITRTEEAMDVLDYAKDQTLNPTRQDRILSLSRAKIVYDAAVLAQPKSSAERMSFVTLAADLAAGKKLAISSGEDDAGVFAREILDYQGLDVGALKASGQVIELNTQDEVMGAVLTGSVDAGILLGSDAAAANLLLSDTAANPLDKVPYPAAILKTSISTGASQNFLDYLRGNGARGIFESLGFEGADAK